MDRTWRPQQLPSPSPFSLCPDRLFCARLAGQQRAADELLKVVRSSSCTAQPRPGRRPSSLPRLQSLPPGLLEGLWKGARLCLIAGLSTPQASRAGRANACTLPAKRTFPTPPKATSTRFALAVSPQICLLIAQTRRICRMRLQAFRDGSCAYPSAPLFCKDGGAGPGRTHRVPKTPTTTVWNLLTGHITAASAKVDAGDMHWLLHSRRAAQRDFFPIHLSPLPQESAALRRPARRAGR